jgi:hypothetical protein
MAERLTTDETCDLQDFLDREGVAWAEVLPPTRARHELLIHAPTLHQDAGVEEYLMKHNLMRATTICRRTTTFYIVKY